MSTLFSLVPVATRMDSGSKPKRDRDKMETEFQNNASSNSLSDIKRVQIHFGRLIIMVTNQLDRNGVSLTEIVSELGIDLNSPAYDDNGERITDVSTFFSFISTSGYMPFYSIAMLESTVDKFAPECLESVDSYKKEHLRPFLLKCLPDLDLECFDHGVLPDQVKLSIRIDREWDTTSLSDIEELTKSLAALLEIPPELLVIETINKEGSVIVEYRVPGAYRVTSLIFSQQKKLRELLVMEFKCDGVVKVLVEDASDDEAQNEICQEEKLPRVLTTFDFLVQLLAALEERKLEESYEAIEINKANLNLKAFHEKQIKEFGPPFVKWIDTASFFNTVFEVLSAGITYEMSHDGYFDQEFGMEIIHLWFGVLSRDQWETFGRATKHKWKLKSYLGQLVVNQNEL